MAGLYDDLEKGAPAAGGGLYDDLVKPGAAKPVTATAAPINLQSAERGIAKAGDKAAKVVGGAIAQGHKDPVGSFLNVMTAPQRGLQSLETNNETDEGKRLGTAWAAMTHPKTGAGLGKKAKEQIGLTGLEAGALAGRDLPHKLARGALDTGLDVVNDPLTFLPVGKLAEGAGKIAKAIPGVERAVGAIGSAIGASPVGQGASKLFNPDHYLRGLTPEAKAQYEVATNKAMEAVRQHKIADDTIVKAHAADIRKGIMPPEVASLFRAEKGQPQDTAWQKYMTDPETGKLKFGPGTKPQDVSRALFESRAPEFKAAARPELEKAGFFTSPSGIDAGRSMGQADKFNVPLNEIPDVQKRLAANIERKMRPQNELIKGARTLTHLGNKAFLANPIPHAFNLSDLAYNKYGAPTVGKGLVNAARVATGKIGGKLGQNVNELESLGAKSQYGNIFDEMGLTRLAGIPGTEGAASLANRALVPLQRASNAAQHKILNSTETGLRAAALDAERKGGATGAQAAKNIHATFGTDAPNAISDAGSGLGAPFMKFHAQTAPGSVLGTLAKNPARISNTVKANRDMNQQVNPHGPKYRSTVPGANAGRMLTDPLSYFVGNLGPISELQSPYGLKAELMKGPKGIEKVAGETAGQFTPGSQEAQALMEILKHKKGRAKESGQQDLITSLLGGYYGK